MQLMNNFHIPAFHLSFLKIAITIHNRISLFFFFSLNLETPLMI